jgi:hypothetical protein
MLCRKKQKDQPNNEHAESEDDAPYRWDEKKWEVPPYKHWEAGNSDYQADERRYWRHQVRALWANVAIGTITLGAAVTAAVIAYLAYQATSAAVVEAQKQTTEVKRQADAAIQELLAGKRANILAHDIAIQWPGPPSAGVIVHLINSGQTYGYLQKIGLVLASLAKNEQLPAHPIYPTSIERKVLVPNNASDGTTTGKIPVPPTDRSLNEIDVTEATSLAFTNHIKAGGDRNLFVYGFLEYSDEYSAVYKNIWNGFCFQFYPDRDIKSSEGDDRFSVCSGNVEAYVYTSHTEPKRQAK